MGFSDLNRITKPFRFLATWMDHKDFEQMVAKNWLAHRPLLSNLYALAAELSKWNKETLATS